MRKKVKYRRGKGPKPKNIGRLRKVYQYVEANPGTTPSQIRKWLGVRYGVAHTILMSMEHNGFLLSEDEEGGLHAFEEKI